MKAFRIIAIAMTALFAQSSFAQGWQIEGGFGNRKPQEPIYDQGYYEVEPSSSQNDIRMETPVTFFAGYVNKTWNTDFDGQIIKENFWGEPNKRLHGFQIGALVEPTADMKVIKMGISTGLAFESYISDSPAVHEAGYDRFSEFGLYMPLHVKLTIPVGEKASLSFYGGLGMNLAIVGTFEEDHEYRDWYGDYHVDTYHDYQDYGNGRFPRHLNFQTEYGAQVKINNFGLNFTYAQGLTNHNLYEGYKTYQNKINIGLSYTF